MKITSGELKNKRFLSREGYKTRPTLQRVKQAIFNIINEKIEDSIFLDLFAGTGNISFEALSRGAKKSIMIESDTEALKIIINNVNNLGLENKCRAYKNNVLRAIEILKNKNEKFDIIFMDPPYKEKLSTDTLIKLSKFDILKEDGIIICEHSKHEFLEDIIDNLEKYDERIYNKKIVSFYRKKSEE